MNRAVLLAIRAPFMLVFALLAVVPPLSAAPLGAGQLPQGQEIKRVYLYSRQRVVLDHLPVCVVYEPPGAAGQQDFTLTNRFGTSTKVTTLRTQGMSIAVGVSVRFLSGESEQSETWKYEQQTKTWRTVVETSGWHTAAHQFPANGDLIVFYLRPQFEITLRIGEAKQ